MIIKTENGFVEIMDDELFNHSDDLLFYENVISDSSFLIAKRLVFTNDRVIIVIYGMPEYIDCISNIRVANAVELYYEEVDEYVLE